MLLLAVSFSFVILNSAKIINLPEIDNNNAVENHVLENNVNGIKMRNADPLWVLRLFNDLDSVKLKAGSEEEIEEFNYYVGPMISRFESRSSTSKIVKKDHPVHPDEPSLYPIHESEKLEESKKTNFNNTHTEIFKLINKFALTFNPDPNSHISEADDDDASVSIYFKGPYTSLMVELGEKQWDYFISPPSPLPAWFYEDHAHVLRDEQAMYVEIPDDVKEIFYEKLLHMLQLFMSFPV